jgi:hypothetical protein
MFGGGRAFDGLIDEVEFFDRVLSQTEIQAIVDAGAAGKTKPPVVPVAPPVGLVSWWPGDGTAVDIQDGNDGLLVGAGTYASGMVGQAFNMNGAPGTRVDVPADTSLQTQRFTVDAWVYARSAGSLADQQGAMIITQDYPGAVSYAISGPGTTGQFSFDIAFAQSVPLVTSHFYSEHSFGLNTWHHVAMTWDGEVLRGYVNGLLEGTLTPPPGATIAYDSSVPVSIGSHSGMFGGGRAFDGLIDEVEFFDRALSQTEIQAIVHAGAAGKDKSPTTNSPPVANAGGPYTVAEGSSTVLDGSQSSDSDGMISHYEWDLDGDNLFGETGLNAVRGDEVGAIVTFSAAGLDGPSSFMVMLRVTDDEEATDMASAAVNVSNVAPTLVISAPLDGYQGVRGQARTLRLSATDPSPSDQIAAFEYAIDWGDGTTTTLIAGNSVDVNHTYVNEGTYTIAATAKDKDGAATSPAATKEVSINVVERQGENVIIAGTLTSDGFLLTLAGGRDIEAAVNGIGYGIFTVGSAGSVQFLGRGGSDAANVQGTSGVDSFTMGASAVVVNGIAFERAGIGSWMTSGSAGNDTFAITDGGAAVDGGIGFDTLDFANYLGPVTVNLQTLSATSVSAFANVESFRATSGASDTLIGPNATGIWNIAGVGFGDVQALRPDGVGQSYFDLFENLTGGSSDDRFVFAAGGSTGSINGGGSSNTLDYSTFSSGVTVDLNTGSATNIASSVSNILIVLGGSGNDLLFGGGDNETLRGNLGNDILVGNGGQDLLYGDEPSVGTNGMDLLIGGNGQDELHGNGKGDILIGGRTSYDANQTALLAILAEWTSGHSYSARLSNIRGPGASSRLNGSYYLKISGPDRTVFDGNAVDSMMGGEGRDWYFAKLGSDIITDQESNETVDVL